MIIKSDPTKLNFRILKNFFKMYIIRFSRSFSSKQIILKALTSTSKFHNNHKYILRKSKNFSLARKCRDKKTIKENICNIM